MRVQRPDDVLTEEQIHRYVGGIAARVARNSPWPKERDDLYQEGLLAVWLADFHQRSFVGNCARWAMLDAQRRWHGRVGHGPRNQHELDMGALDAPLHRAADAPALVETLGGLDAGYAAYDDADELAQIRADIAKLEPQLRDAVERRLAGETLKEIGVAYGVTESRVCQLVAKACVQLAFAQQQRTPNPG